VRYGCEEPKSIRRVAIIGIITLNFYKLLHLFAYILSHLSCGAGMS